MKSLQVKHLCTTCDLGTPIAEPQVVAGGLLHHMWQLSTTRGSFAVKQLNPAIMRRGNVHEEYRLTERIAAAMAAHSIPAVTALPCADDPLQIIEDEAFIVYKWVAGEVLSSGPAPIEQARQMGKILGQMHALQLHHLELPPLNWMHFHYDDWDILTFQAADRGLPWTYPVRASMPMLLQCSKWYQEAGKALSQTLVISHRDLDQKNVLWQDAHSPRLIDWEAAGLINPTMELVGLALDWSGQATGEAQQAVFSAVMEGYVQTGGIVRDPGLLALHGKIGTWLGWLLFNMRRSLGESVMNEEEQQLGIRETASTLAILRSIVKHLEIWATWIDKWH